MKKIALTSLLAVCAASGASAANIMNDNPLYRPDQGHFYSETSLFSHTENIETVGLAEEFGYGITDKLAVALRTDMVEMDAFKGAEWGTLGLAVNYRVFDRGPWKVDALGGASVSPFIGNHEGLLEKDLTRYTWTAGLRGGYTVCRWTVAGHVLFEYGADEMFKWTEDDVNGSHILRAGVDGQYIINKYWNVVAGVEYTGILDSEADNAGVWTGKAGINFNIDETKYVGAYVSAAMDHWKDDGKKGWEVNDGVGLGLKFGIDF